MAGLYDGLEEVAFKQVAGGYVFQTNNPWLIGPQRRYFVNEAQKAEIAACIRQTLRRITPFVLAAAILIPLVLVAAVFWFVIGSGPTVSLTVASVVDQTSQSTVSTLPIGPTGATFPYAAQPPVGTMAITAISVSGSPGSDAVASFTVVDLTGKSTTYTQPFGPAGSKFTFSASNGSAVFTLVGRAGRTSGAIYLYTALLGLGIFVPYLALVHAYRMWTLQPLIAGLPRSDERITLREHAEGLAAKMSLKFLLVAIVALIAGVTTLSGTVIHAILEDRPIPPMGFLTMATSSLTMAYFGYLLVLKLKQKRSAG
jgi:hypothetical protein